jgi:hypothetical protein
MMRLRNTVYKLFIYRGEVPLKKGVAGQEVVEIIVAVNARSL